MSGRRPLVARTRDELLDTRFGLLAERGGEVAVVMTMGALHPGHAALMQAARDRVGPDGRVFVTIFVNPLQFGTGEDFGRYPRTLDADLKVCAREGVDLVFAPTRDVVYPSGEPRVRVHPGDLGDELEGASRPGHFTGVLTVVCKLLGLTAPRFALFGEKDYQQLVLVRRMVDDLDLGVEIIAVPTVREPDGLAMSSRNRYLSPAERAAARAVPRALEAGVTAGPRGGPAVLAAASEVLDGADGVDVDYVALRGPNLEAAPVAGEARLLVAVRIGETRIIDNAYVYLFDRQSQRIHEGSDRAPHHAQVQDSPRHHHAGRPALRGVDHR